MIFDLFRRQKSTLQSSIENILNARIVAQSPAFICGHYGIPDHSALYTDDQTAIEEFLESTKNYILQQDKRIKLLEVTLKERHALSIIFSIKAVYVINKKRESIEFETTIF